MVRKDTLLSAAVHLRLSPPKMTGTPQTLIDSTVRFFHPSPPFSQPSPHRRSVRFSRSSRLWLQSSGTSSLEFWSSVSWSWNEDRHKEKP